MKAIWQVMLFADYSFELYQRILDLPPSAKFILYILRKNEFLNRKALENESLLPKRTIGEALQILLKERLYRKNILGNCDERTVRSQETIGQPRNLLSFNLTMISFDFI